MSKLLFLSSSLIALAWILSKCHVRKGPPLSNDEGVVYYNPKNVLTPVSLPDIQKAIQSARKSGRRIRPLGSGHSWSPNSISDDLYLSLDSYRGMVSIDREKKLATFRGGTKLWEINKVLDKYGLALSLLPSISNQTIGGAIATGTHHTGVDFGNMATFVTEIELVTGTGEVLSITSSDKLFHAAGISLGLLGVITEVTLQCEDSFNLEETRTSHTLSHCLNNMNQVAASAEHVKLWIEMNTGQCTVYTANRTIEETRDYIPQPATDIKLYAYEILQWLWSVLPFTATCTKGMTLLFSTDIFSYYNRVGRSWEVFNIPHYVAPCHREAEISVPQDKCSELIEAVIDVKERFNIPINHIIEVRFVRSDEFWLSNQYQRDTCHVTQLLYNPSDYYWKTYEEEVYKLALQYGGRPHWGKSYSMGEEVEKLYPMLKDFLGIRKMLDPDGVFVSDHIANLFSL